MSRRVHHEERTTMKVEYGHVAFDFCHEFRVMLAFGKVRPVAVIINVGAVAGPLCLNRRHNSSCVFLTWLF